MRSRSVLLLLPLLSACAGHAVHAGAPPPRAPAPRPDSAVPDEIPLVASVEHTACYGACPVYSVSVWQDGLVAFDGREHVALAGTREQAVSAETVAAIEAAIARAEVATLADAYERRFITDLPTTITTVTDAHGTTKRIRRYHGDNTAPQRLLTLEKEIEALLGVEWWLSGATEVQVVQRPVDPTYLGPIWVEPCYGCSAWGPTVVVVPGGGYGRPRSHAGHGRWGRDGHGRDRDGRSHRDEHDDGHDHSGRNGHERPDDDRVSHGGSGRGPGGPDDGRGGQTGARGPGGPDDGRDRGDQGPDDHGGGRGVTAQPPLPRSPEPARVPELVAVPVPPRTAAIPAAPASAQPPPPPAAPRVAPGPMPGHQPVAVPRASPVPGSGVLGTPRSRSEESPESRPRPGSTTTPRPEVRSLPPARPSPLTTPQPRPAAQPVTPRAAAPAPVAPRAPSAVGVPATRPRGMLPATPSPAAARPARPQTATPRVAPMQPRVAPMQPRVAAPSPSPSPTKKPEAAKKAEVRPLPRKSVSSPR